MWDAGEFFPYRTFSIPRYATLDQILTAIRNDTLFDSWSARVPSEKRTSSIDEVRTRSAEYFISLRDAFQTLETYKSAVEATFPSFKTQTRRCENSANVEYVAEAQEKIQNLITRFVDLQCLASDSMLRGEATQPELCEAFDKAVTWERNMGVEAWLTRMIGVDVSSRKLAAIVPC